MKARGGRGSRWRTLVAAAGIAMAGGFGDAAPAQESTERPLNVVLIYADDLGWRDTGFMGSTYYETPHLDELARRSMIFTAAYSVAPNCAPSRASLMTGLYTPRHRIFTVGSPARGRSRDRKLIPIANTAVLSDRFVTLPQILLRAGYATATMGKWHLGATPLGFELNVGGNESGIPVGGYFSPYDNPQLPDGPSGEYLTDRLASEAVQFVGANQDRPFFLYLTHYAVHTPLQAKGDLIERFRDKPPAGGHDNPTYAAMIASLDDSVGAVMAALEAADVADRTLVIFHSDNGGYGPATTMGPLRGAKGMLYEGGIRVPLTIHWPGEAEGGRSDEPVIGIDLLPTIAEIVGVAAPRHLDGESLVPLLRGAGEMTRDALFWHFPAYLEAFRQQRESGPFRTTPAGAIRLGSFKLIEYFEDSRLELYDLDHDIGESHDLSESMPDKTAELYERLIRWRELTGAPVPTQLNPDYDPGS